MDLRGVLPILATPFHEDERLDEEGLARLVDWELERGVQGLTILGIAGEVYKLTDGERDRVTEIVVRRVGGRIPVVVGAGHPGGTRATIEYCRRAEGAGAAALMVAPPFIARPSGEQIAEFYAAVAEAVSIPIVLQDEPVTTGVVMPAALIARIATAVPAVRYAKVEHVPTPPKFSDIAALVPDERLGLFGGTGAMYFFEELQRGARGIMTGFAFPEALVQVWERFRDGDEAGAADVYYRWLPLIKLEGQPVITVAVRKEILRRRGALRDATVRRPAPTLDAGTLRELDLLLARLT